MQISGNVPVGINEFLGYHIKIHPTIHFPLAGKAKSSIKPKRYRILNFELLGNFVKYIAVLGEI